MDMQGVGWVGSEGNGEERLTGWWDGGMLGYKWVGKIRNVSCSVVIYVC